MARKVVDDYKAAEPSTAADELLYVVGNALSLIPVVHQVEGDPADGANRTPLSSRRIIPSDGVALRCACEHTLGPKAAVSDQASRADQEMFLQSRRHGLFLQKVRALLAAMGIAWNEAGHDRMVTPHGATGRHTASTPLDGNPDGLRRPVVGNEEPAKGIDPEGSPGLIVLAGDGPCLYQLVHFQGEQSAQCLAKVVELHHVTSQSGCSVAETRLASIGSMPGSGRSQKKR
jgi:hypothetical protein